MQDFIKEVLVPMEKVVEVRRGRKVDTDRNQATAGQYGIRSIPTVIKFDGGAKVAEQAGAMRLPQIEAFAGVG